MAPQALRPAAPSIFTVVGRAGGRMRAGVEMDSLHVSDLPQGSHVVVHERGVTRTGAARCRVVAGEAQGWLSEKILAPADGVAAADRARLIDSALRLLATSAMASDWAPDDGPPTTPAGSRSRASDTARSALHAVTTAATFRAAGRADAEDGPVATPAGTQSRATTAARSALRAATTSAAFRAPAAVWPEDGPASTPPGAPGLFRPTLQPPLHCRVCLQRLPCECPTPVPAASTSSLEDGPP